MDILRGNNPSFKIFIFFFSTRNNTHLQKQYYQKRFLCQKAKQFPLGPPILIKSFAQEKESFTFLKINICSFDNEMAEMINKIIFTIILL